MAFSSTANSGAATSASPATPTFVNTWANSVSGIALGPAERFFRFSLLLLIFTSVCTLALTGKLDPLSVILAPAAVLYKGVRWWRGRPAELSHGRATWLVIGYLAFFPVDVFLVSRFLVENSSNPPLYSALLGAVHFLLFVTLVRLYSAAHDRDALFLTMLAFAGILASAVLTVDTTFLFCFFAFLMFGVATFVGLELRRAATGALMIAAPVGQPDRERRLNRALSFASLSVALGAIALGGTLFFFFPRFSAGYLGRTSFNPALMTGFNDDVELGQIGEIKKNSTIVMRVETGKPVNFPRLRWRGIALAKFDGKRWTSAERSAQTLLPNADGWIYTGAQRPGASSQWAGPQNGEAQSTEAQKIDARAPGLLYTVYLEPIASDAIFVPGNAVSLRGNFNGESGNVTSTARRTYLFKDAAGSLFNPFHNYTAVRYAGFSRLPALDIARLRAAPSEYPEDIKRVYLQLPALDRRIAPLAQQITARSTTPYDKASAMELYLRSRFGYTLNLIGKSGDDPLAHFLFETHAGHCEYFASAMTVMLRTLGIPAREVNGFLPGEYNDLGGDYVVRASDAHSWVEAYFPENGWVTFDPTPAAPANAGGFFSRLAQYMDWISLAWNEWIISYDFAHQTILAQNLKSSSRTWTEALRATFDKGQQRGRDWIKNWEFQHSRLRYLLPVALVLLLVVLRVNMIPDIFHWLKLHLQMRIGHLGTTNPELASKLYHELLRALGRRGIFRADAQTPLEFAAAVNDARLSPAVQEFTEIYGRARFGHLPCNAARLRELLTEVRTALRSR
jgi:transglutaminase-like putative cysteine protease